MNINIILLDAPTTLPAQLLWWALEVWLSQSQNLISIQLFTTLVEHALPRTTSRSMLVFRENPAELLYYII